ncbi:MAG: sialidase family protein [Planctomycetia bacterium]|nr:sialidase family protein [Planctomycetia bacterium]
MSRRKLVNNFFSRFFKQGKPNLKNADTKMTQSTAIERQFKLFRLRFDFWILLGFILGIMTNGVILSQEITTNGLSKGEFIELQTDSGVWTASENSAAIIVPPNQSRTSLHFWGTGEQFLCYSLSQPQKLDSVMLDVERWTSAAPFELNVEAEFVEPEKGRIWKNVLKLDAATPVGFDKVYRIAINGTVDALRFHCSAPEKMGILLHGMTFIDQGPMTLEGVRLVETQPVEPILISTDGKPRSTKVATIEITTKRSEKPLKLSSLPLFLSEASFLAKIDIQWNSETIPVQTEWKNGPNLISFSPNDLELQPGKNILSVLVVPSEKANPDETIRIGVSSPEISLTDQNSQASTKDVIAPVYLEPFKFDPEPLEYSFGVLIRDLGQDGVNGYRIPALAKSKKGTLLAVYDIRRRHCNDLPADIDIGCSRSFDQGKTWQPMQIVMDFKGEDETKEGVGDPAILVDDQTGRIWVGGLWAHNGYSTEASLPNLDPETSGQFVLTYSDDDGETWAEPFSITQQAAPGKDWRILFQGPGMGITMRDGTLVFPAQFIDKDKIWFSTIVWSNDSGKTWNCGTGARPGTCEAQVVELNDGSLMINMRNFEGRARSVAITKDLGKTWTEHPTSMKALPEPICQASLLRVASVLDGDDSNILAFFNPCSTKARVDMTLQFSFDEGNSWTKSLLINKNNCWGYSCMEMLDKETIALLYETCGGLIFQKVDLTNIKSSSKE